MKSSFIKAVFLLIICLPMMACSGGTGGTGDPGPAPQASAVDGAAQKGPFIIGSDVKVYHLDEAANISGLQGQSQTTDYLGRFRVENLSLGGKLIEVEGQYRDELSGRVTRNSLKLKSIVNIKDEGSVTANVNIFTHIVHKRVLYLVANEGLSFDDAITKAEEDLINYLRYLFVIPEYQPFATLNIYQASGSDSGYLLAFSVVLTQYAVDLAALTAADHELVLIDLLSQLVDSFESTGQLNLVPVLTNDFIEDLASSEQKINPDEITETVNGVYLTGADAGLTASDINRYIDTDNFKLYDTINDQYLEWPNEIDLDDDNDGVDDIDDAFPYDPTEYSDFDGDGVGDNSDNCVFDFNPDQLDVLPATTQGMACESDLTGVVDANDPDEDLIITLFDNCPLDYNPYQNDMDVDGVGDRCDLDIDGDSYLNVSDNCPYVSNINQEKDDLNFPEGNACSARFDSDQDGLHNAFDNCPLHANFDQIDSDNDGYGDACD